MECIAAHIFSPIIADLVGGVLQFDELATNIVYSFEYIMYKDHLAPLPIYYLFPPLEQANHLFATLRRFNIWLRIRGIESTSVRTE